MNIELEIPRLGVPFLPFASKEGPTKYHPLLETVFPFPSVTFLLFFDIHNEQGGFRNRIVTLRWI